MAILLTPDEVSEVQSRILHVAERQMQSRGSAAVSLRSIAAEMGWTAASLYRYYDSKAQLVSGARAAACNRFSDRIEAASRGTDDLWERSRAIGDAYAAFAFDEPAAYKLIFAFEQAEEEKSDELVQAEQRAETLMLTYVSEMVQAGLVEGDPNILAHVYWAALHGLVALQMAGKLKKSPSFTELRRASNRLITRSARPL